MKKNILLINAPSDPGYFISALPPVGVLSLASFLRKNGVEVSVLDLNVDRKWRKTLCRAVRDLSPSVVGISTNFSNRAETLEIAALVKKMRGESAVVVGGPHPSIAPSEYRSADIDYIIPYEAERVLFDFLRSENGKDVPGVIVCGREDPDESLKAISRIPVECLDDLPFPAYDLVDLRKYYGSIYRRRPLASLVTSRGCPYTCTFCSQTVFERRWKAFSADYVVEEMGWLTEKLGVREILIEDDNFTFDMDRVSRICALIRKKGIRIPWQLSNGIRADRLTRDLLRDMKEAGCWKISIAPEVGDEESLKMIHKNMGLDHFRDAARWCRELGVTFFCFFLMGFPFQQKRHMENTIRFALELDPLMIDLNKVVPFPGTEFFSANPDRGVYRKHVTYIYRSRDVLLEEMCSRGYRVFYGRPGKLLEIFRIMGWRQFFAFVAYAFRVFILQR
jgi:radical SAM superfamily enzyme YgiQ (UPF0313 family)